MARRRGGKPARHPDRRADFRFLSVGSIQSKARCAVRRLRRALRRAAGLQSGAVGRAQASVSARLLRDGGGADGLCCLILGGARLDLPRYAQQRSAADQLSAACRVGGVRGRLRPVVFRRARLFRLAAHGEPNRDAGGASARGAVRGLRAPCDLGDRQALCDHLRRIGGDRGADPVARLAFAQQFPVGVRDRLGGADRACLRAHSQQFPPHPVELLARQFDAPVDDGRGADLQPGDRLSHSLAQPGPR